MCLCNSHTAPSSTASKASIQVFGHNAPMSPSAPHVQQNMPSLFHPFSAPFLLPFLRLLTKSSELPDGDPSHLSCSNSWFGSSRCHSCPCCPALLYTASTVMSSIRSSSSLFNSLTTSFAAIPTSGGPPVCPPAFRDWRCRDFVKDDVSSVSITW